MILWRSFFAPSFASPTFILQETYCNFLRTSGWLRRYSSSSSWLKFEKKKAASIVGDVEQSVPRRSSSVIHSVDFPFFLSLLCFSFFNYRRSSFENSFSPLLVSLVDWLKLKIGKFNGLWYYLIPCVPRVHDWENDIHAHNLTWGSLITK